MQIENMKTYTRDNILSPMLKTVIIRTDFSGLTSVRSFVNRIKLQERMKEAFENMEMIPKQNMKVTFRPKDIEEGQLPITENQKSIIYRFFDCNLGGHSKATLDVEPESITLAVDCRDGYCGSRDYSFFMGWLTDELRAFDQYVTINRLGVRKIDVQVLKRDEPLEKYFNKNYVVAQSWRNSPPKTKSILTELLEIQGISFNVVQHIDYTSDERVRLIFDVDSFVNDNYLKGALKTVNPAELLYHPMQDIMFDLFVNVVSDEYLDFCKELKTKRDGQ